MYIYIQEPSGIFTSLYAVPLLISNIALVWLCYYKVVDHLSSCRQLEAVVRIAESLAKMKLQPIAGEEEVDEALRLFQVSTLDAALSGSLSGKCVGL